MSLTKLLLDNAFGAESRQSLLALIAQPFISDHIENLMIEYTTQTGMPINPREFESQKKIKCIVAMALGNALMGSYMTASYSMCRKDLFYAFTVLVEHIMIMVQNAIPQIYNMGVIKEILLFKIKIGSIIEEHDYSKTYPPDHPEIDELVTGMVDFCHSIMIVQTYLWIIFTYNMYTPDFSTALTMMNNKFTDISGVMYMAVCSLHTINIREGMFFVKFPFSYQIPDFLTKFYPYSGTDTTTQKNSMKAYFPGFWLWI